MKRNSIVTSALVFLLILILGRIAVYAWSRPCYVCRGRNCRFKAEECRHGGGNCSSDADCGGDDDDDPPPPPPPVPRTISGSIHETTNVSSCSNDGVLNLSGLNAKAYRGSVQIGTTSNITPAGTYSISGVFNNTAFSSLTINGSLSTVTESFIPACVRANISGCTLGSGAVVNCTPRNGLSAGNVTIRVGFTRSYNEKWFTAVDGDVYSYAVVTSVAPAPLGGFTPNIINTLTSGSIGGFGFTGGTIDTTTTGSGATEKGGKAERLNTSVGMTFENKWLSKFSFAVPAGSTSRPILTSAPDDNDFEAGSIYSLSVDQFNSVLNDGNYTITESNGTRATAIVYVTGGGTIQINDEFTSDDPDNQVLLVITDSPVEIADDVEFGPAAGLTITSPSQVDLNIISGSSITTLSKYDASTSTPDNPIVINGSLMAKTVIDFKRDLGSADNILFPGEVIRFYPHLMSLIPSYEIQYGSSGIYTGLTTMDVQFDYGR